MSEREVTGGPGWYRLKRHPDAEAMRLRTLAEQEKALREVAQRPTQPPEKEQEDYPKSK
jgi:hypothetical protein